MVAQTQTVTRELVLVAAAPEEQEVALVVHQEVLAAPDYHPL
jgi:hypothetical protein